MDSYRHFYESNKDRLFGYLFRKTANYHLAIDIVQESFTRYLEQYNELEYNPALLFTIARNLLFDYYRKNRGMVTFVDEDHGGVVDQEQKYQVQEEVKQVFAAMQLLKDDQRDILALVASSGLSYREIAELTGNSEANVKVKIHRARMKLKQILKGQS